MTDKENLKLKLAYVPGLRGVVLSEIKNKTNFEIVGEDKDAFYIEYMDNFEEVKILKTVSRAYLVDRSANYNPFYISNHKSILSDLIKIVKSHNEANSFKSFKINCAGSDSKEILEIKEYIRHEFAVGEKDEADLKIYIAKKDEAWEVGIQITSRPLSLREYKVRNMSGAMDPTIAYSLNYLCELEKYETYLNVFSGSATLMIEAGLNYDNLEKIIGFDNNKEHLSLSVQNIKKAGLIKKANVKEFDVKDQPDLGSFDVITSDLPFGMSISKGEDLESLYKTFIEYCEKHLNEGGRLGVYTSQFKIFESLISRSNFKLEKEVKIDLITNENEYLPVKIMVFGLGNLK
ncbi:methyltransferase [Candidatus Parcubacteria bacterium]|nr:methyltransferase [Candidatus Parcubacteria bacterium]